MRKIHKITNIALIYSLIGAFLCQDLVYSLPARSNLRPLLQSNHLAKKTIDLMQEPEETNAITRRQFLKKIVNKKTPLVLLGGFLGYNLGLFTIQKLWAQGEGQQNSAILEKYVEDLSSQELDEVEGALTILSISEITLPRLDVIERLYKQKKLYIVKADDVQKIAELVGDKIGKGADAATLALSKDGLTTDLYLVVIQKNVIQDLSRLVAVVTHELCGNLYNFYINGPPSSRTNAAIFAYNSSVRILGDIVSKMKEKLNSITSSEDLEQTRLLIAILEKSLEIERRDLKSWMERKQEMSSLDVQASTIAVIAAAEKFTPKDDSEGNLKNARSIEEAFQREGYIYTKALRQLVQGVAENLNLNPEEIRPVLVGTSIYLADEDGFVNLMLIGDIDILWEIPHGLDSERFGLIRKKFANKLYELLKEKVKDVSLVDELQRDYILSFMLPYGLAAKIHIADFDVPDFVEHTLRRIKLDFDYEVLKEYRKHNNDIKVCMMLLYYLRDYIEKEDRFQEFKDKYLAILMPDRRPGPAIQSLSKEMIDFIRSIKEDKPNIIDDNIDSLRKKIKASLFPEPVDGLKIDRMIEFTERNRNQL